MFLRVHDLAQLPSDPNDLSGLCNLGLARNESNSLWYVNMGYFVFRRLLLHTAVGIFRI